MPTLVVIDGFEHGVRSTAGGFYNDAPGGSIVTTAPRSGLYSLESNGGFESVRYSLTAVNVNVGVFYFRVSGSPSGEQLLLKANSGTRYFAFVLDTSRQLAAIIHDGTSEKSRVTRTGALTVDTWYRVEWKMATNGGGGNVYTFDWKVALGDGTATDQTQVTSTEASGQTISLLRIGEGISGITVYYDDVLISQTAGDYPLGPHKILGYSPVAVGTHNLDASTSAYFFKDVANTETALTNVESTSHQTIDDVPMTLDADHIGIRGAIADATLYAEYALADSGETVAPVAVAAMVTLLQDSAATCSIAAKLRANGNDGTIYSGDINSATNIFKRAFFATAPGGAAWTDAIFDGATIRWGFTNNAGGTPRMAAAFVEAAFPVSGLTLDSCLPDADVTTTGWTTTPLFSKVNDSSDATVIQATAS